MTWEAVGARPQWQLPPSGRAVVAVVGPAGIDQAPWLRAAGATVVVILDGLADAGVLERGGVTPAVLACDALVAVVPAEVGLDTLTAGVWHAAAAAGLPRAVLVTGLGAETADFEDIAAIAERALGPECVPVALPVFDDDEAVIAVLDLADGVISGPVGPTFVERAHLRFSAGARLRLITALAGITADDATAERALEVVTAAQPDDPDADRIVWSAEGESGVWSLAMPLAAAVADGFLAPVLPEPTARGPHDGAASVQDRILAWITGSAEVSRGALVRRDVHNEPCDGPAAVVLAVQGQRAVVRPIYGDAVPTAGLLTLTRTGSATADPTGPLLPYRSWPVGVVDHEDLDGYALVTLTMRPAVGDVLTDRPLWLVAADEDTE